jgi:linoleoyl-CoA desaturase
VSTDLQAGPSARLGPDAVARLGQELDAIRQEVVETRGARDAAYIRRLITIQRGLELGGRVLLQASSRRRTGWLAGTTALALAKVLDTMEIGHNVLHGQWDWMRDPRIHSSTWEWDYVTPAALWRRSHNEGHHRFTNILGKDNDLGFGIMRVDEAQPWRPRHLMQPFLNLLNAVVFEYGIAAYDLELGRLRRGETSRSSAFHEDLRVTLGKARRQLTKDFVVFPLLSGRAWKATLLANLTANLARNLWSHSVIMCGHFPEGVETFEQEAVRADESRGDWYLRQMLGSADITGPPLLHVLTGNLSHQIEHHLFPDLPSNRYGEIAPKVRATVERFGLRYHARPMPHQVASAWHKVLRLSLPDGWLAGRLSRRLSRRRGRPVGRYVGGERRGRGTRSGFPHRDIARRVPAGV